MDSAVQAPSSPAVSPIDVIRPVAHRHHQATRLRGEGRLELNPVNVILGFCPGGVGGPQVH